MKNDYLKDAFLDELERLIESECDDCPYLSEKVKQDIKEQKMRNLAKKVYEKFGTL